MRALVSTTMYLGRLKPNPNPGTAASGCEKRAGLAGGPGPGAGCKGTTGAGGGATDARGGSFLTIDAHISTDAARAPVPPAYAC